MQRKIITTLFLLIILGVGAYELIPLFKEKIQDIKSSEFRPEFFTHPIQSFVDKEDENAHLTREAIIKLTNEERVKVGDEELVENDKLDQAAEKKLDDMFAKQYFEHISPDGHGPGYLAEQAGYQYIIVGENLALGNFKDDAALLAAWMASPGHKENILKDRYIEMGAAARFGTYQGRKVWMAVQEFGTPVSECPSIDKQLKTSIDSYKKQADNLEADLTARKQALQTMPHNTPDEVDAYNTKTKEYNAEVSEYNDILNKLKTAIDEYNAEVRAFNACIKS